MVTPNDPAVHVYFVADHSATDIAGSTGQVQWVVREDLNKFPNIYSVNPDLSNPGPIAIPAFFGFRVFFFRRIRDEAVWIRRSSHGFTDIPAGFAVFRR